MGLPPVDCLLVFHGSPRRRNVKLFFELGASGASGLALYERRTFAEALHAFPMRVLFAALLCILAALHAFAAPDAPRPNIVLILSITSATATSPALAQRCTA